MKNYMLVIESHPINGYRLEYDIIKNDSNIVNNVKNMVIEYYSGLLPYVNIKFENESDIFKTNKIIRNVIDSVVSCETLDDINKNEAISVVLCVSKKKNKVKVTKEPVIIETVKKKVKRVKFI